MKQLTFSVLFLLFAGCLFAQQQNLFGTKFTRESLSKVIIPQAQWLPFSKIDDRKAWQRVDSTEMKQLVTKAESFLNYHFQGIPATVILDFKRTGDRLEHEKYSFTKRRVLSCLLLAEIYENKGRFMDQIVNGVWSICEESYWGIPAHLNQWHAGVGLPDVTDPYVDLFAAETAAMLSWIDYFVGDQLDVISPLIRKRIYDETNQRIFTPLITSNHPWMGFNENGRRPNNWNPWICSNWLATALLLEKNDQRRVDMVAKILTTLDQYLNPYPQDGGCDEGPHYWGVAHASLFDNIELLNLASNNAFKSLYQDERIRNMGRFIYKAQIGPDYFLNFADAPPKLAVAADLVYRFGKAIEDTSMMQFGAYYQKDSLTIDRIFVRTLFELFNHDDLSKTQKRLPLPKDAWYPDIQVLMARDKEASAEGFYLAAKGGNNDESHNHNDIGNFVVYYNGLPLLIDVGRGTYTAKTFSKQRYDIWSNTSDYHNLPTINGKEQVPGAAFKATNVNYTKGTKTAQLSLDIVQAYPQDAQVKSWLRTVTLVRGKEVKITDAFVFSKSQSFSQHFMTCYLADASKAGEVVIHYPGKNFTIQYDAKTLRVSIEKVKMDAPEDAGIKNSWGDSIYRINLDLKNPIMKGQTSYSIQPK